VFDSLHQPSCLPLTRLGRHPSCLLQVSWLGAWALLLGFRDYQKEEHRRKWLPCLRPEEADMLAVVQLWARIASAAEVRPAWSGQWDSQWEPGGMALCCIVALLQYKSESLLLTMCLPCRICRTS
jgi:hypothetical protein